MRVAFVPSPPFLLPGFQPPADLLAACTSAVASLGPDVTVLGAAPSSGLQSGTVDPTPYGVAGTPAEDPLPLALAVGRHLLGRDAQLYGAAADVDPGDLRRTVGDGDLLVVADGTAMRSEKAPRHFDARAEAWDAELVTAISHGQPLGLLELSAHLGAELHCRSLAVWACLARAGQVPWGLEPGWHADASPRWTTEVLYDGAPFGVGYVVATWTPVPDEGPAGSPA